MNVLSGFFVTVLITAIVLAYRQGKAAARKQALEVEHESVAAAKKWRDRLRVDGDFVRRLRARFRRNVLPPL